VCIRRNLMRILEEVEILIIYIKEIAMVLVVCFLLGDSPVSVV
jgi:hypothetical protein